MAGKVLVNNRFRGELVSDLSSSGTVIHLKPGHGAYFPEVALDSDDFFFVTLADLNGSKEVIKIIMRASGSDDLVVGTTKAHQPAGHVSGRAQEGTAALTVSYLDNHLVEQRLTAGMYQAVIDEIDSILSTLAVLGATIVPSGEIILFEKDTAVNGYTLLTDVDDMQIYVTKGSAAAGEAGGTNKAGGTWTQPDHKHTTSQHHHATADHQLAVNEMPSHGHTGTAIAVGAHGHSVTGFARDATGGTSSGLVRTSTGSNNYSLSSYMEIVSAGAHGHTLSINNNGGGLGHNHGDTSDAGGEDTGDAATANTWRPPGRNFTRQQRN